MTVRRQEDLEFKLEDLELWIGAAHRLLREAVHELSASPSVLDGLSDRYETLRSGVIEMEVRLRKLHDELLRQTCTSRRTRSLTGRVQ